MVAIKNYSTTIPAKRTLAEIQDMLLEHGASEVQFESKDKQVSAIKFVIDVGDLTLRYRLPCRWQQIHGLLKDDAKAQEVMRGKGIVFGEAHCRAIGWRLVRDWLDAQLALVEAEMAELKEVMLPYMLANDGRSAYEVLGGGRLLLLEKKG